MRYLFAALIAYMSLAIQAAFADTIYKCKNQQGSLLYQEQPCAETTKSVSSWGSASASALVIAQGSQGHYYVDGAVNTHKLNFVIDTGASVVTLPQSDADAAGLVCKSRTSMKTGNGTVQACLTTISNLKFGGFTLKNVEAIIAPNLGQPLLGMNVLNRFRIEQDAGEMRLTTK